MGGPADVRELPGLTISKLAVSEMANNAYLLRSTATGEGLLVDAAAEPEAVLALIGDGGVSTVVTTHGHWDHHRALPEVVEATGAVTVAGTADAADLPVPVQRTVEHGDTLTVGDQSLEVVHLRGHTPGSIALVWRGPGDAGVHVFTGDSLFPGGVGNTQQDAARFASLIDDVEERLFGTLPDDDVGLPGPRQGHDDRRRASAPRRVARSRLVGTATCSRSRGNRRVGRRSGSAAPEGLASGRVPRVLPPLVKRVAQRDEAAHERSHDHDDEHEAAGIARPRVGERGQRSNGDDDADRQRQPQVPAACLHPPKHGGSLGAEQASG